MTPFPDMDSDESDDEDDGMDENGEYRFERSDPPVWWEGEELDYPIQKTLYEWLK